MLQACEEVGISHVVMEQKKQHGEGLPIEISWTTALARAYFDKQNSAPSPSGGGGAAADAPALPAQSGGGGAAASVETE